jgi:Tol biopolymer transport system component
MIELRNTDGTGVRQLSEGGTFNSNPSVSPDGRYVVYSSVKSGSKRLRRVDIDGNNAVDLTQGADDSDPQFTADGNWVIYLSRKDGNRRLFLVSINGKETRKLFDQSVQAYALSPDGRFIACSLGDDKMAATKLIVLPIEGGNPVKNFDLPSSVGLLRWSSDGNAITYVRTIRLVT